jgi:hypothetical protein
MSDAARCGWCRQPGHAEGDHPLPKDHPQYDAFYDANDDELSQIVQAALRRQGWDGWAAR